ncbi:MAG: hypothetical protein SFW07_05395 [Gammaproteobacteria bacterium]|nr:hypothetical protein [Gammaproteobacteria bacterium]
MEEEALYQGSDNVHLLEEGGRAAAAPRVIIHEADFAGVPRQDLGKAFIHFALKGIAEARDAFEFSKLRGAQKFKFVAKIGGSVVASVSIGVPTWILYGTTGQTAAKFITKQLNSTIPVVIPEMLDEAAGILTNVMLNALGTVLAMFAFFYYISTKYQSCGRRAEHIILTDKEQSALTRFLKFALWQPLSTFWLVMFPSVAQGFLMILEKPEGTPVDGTLLFWTILNITTNIPQMVLAVSDIHKPTPPPHWKIMLDYLTAQKNIFLNQCADAPLLANQTMENFYRRVDVLATSDRMTAADILHVYLTLFPESGDQNKLWLYHQNQKELRTAMGRFFDTWYGDLAASTYRNMGTVGALGFTLITAYTAERLSRAYITTNFYALAVMYAIAFGSTWVPYKKLFGGSINSVLAALSTTQETVNSLAPWAIKSLMGLITTGTLGAFTLAGFLLFPFSGATGQLVTAQSIYTIASFLTGMDIDANYFYIRMLALTLSFCSLLSTPGINIRFYSELMDILRTFFTMHFFWMAKDQSLQERLQFGEMLEKLIEMLGNMPETNQNILLSEIAQSTVDSNHSTGKILMALARELSPTERQAFCEAVTLKTGYDQEEMSLEDKQAILNTVLRNLDIQDVFEKRTKKAGCWGRTSNFFSRLARDASEWWNRPAAAHDTVVPTNSRHVVGYNTL